MKGIDIGRMKGRIEVTWGEAGEGSKIDRSVWTHPSACAFRGEYMHRTSQGARTYGVRVEYGRGVRRYSEGTPSQEGR